MNNDFADAEAYAWIALAWVQAKYSNNPFINNKTRICY